MDRFDEGDQAVLTTQEEKLWPERPFTDLDGKKHWLQIVKRPLSDKVNQITHVLGIAIDVTLIKNTTNALREKEEQFRTLVEASFDGIVISIDHVIQEANINFVTMFGYADNDEVLGKNFAQFLKVENVDLLQNMKSHQKILLEAVGLRKDESTFPVEIVSQSISFQGQTAQISGFQDISNRKQAEEAKQHARKLESLSIMAGGLAHDFNNLLVAMMGQISIAKAKMDEEHASHDNLDKAIRAMETAALLTRQLLAYTGHGHFEVEPVQLNSFISQNIHHFQDSLPPNITLQANLHETLPHIQADSVQIQQIIINLLLNAADAIGSQVGSVTLTTAPYHLTPDQIDHWQQPNETVAAGNFVLLEVADTGCGMNNVTQNRIFDPFYSTKGAGRGLGLAAVLGIVRGHKGVVKIKSQVGQGTSFRFLFPADETEPPEAETAVSQAQPDRKIVLVIDDDKQVREAICDILELDDVAVIAAADGEEGVALFADLQAQLGLVILDLSMPGMNGIDTFAALQEIDPTVKVILSSGYTEGEVRQKMTGTQPTGYLQKPYRIETVLHTVDKYLND